MNDKTEKLILKTAKSVIKETVERNITESDKVLGQCIRTYLSLVFNKDSYSVDIDTPNGLHTHRLDVSVRVHSGTRELKMKI
jgi:hypothetical protein